MFFSATVKLPAEKFAPSSDASAGPTTSAAADLSEPKKIILNSSEELFAELRDRNFHAVGPVLSKKAKLISAEFDVITSVLLMQFILLLCIVFHFHCNTVSNNSSGRSSNSNQQQKLLGIWLFYIYLYESLKCICYASLLYYT